MRTEDVRGVYAICTDLQIGEIARQWRGRTDRTLFPRIAKRVCVTAIPLTHTRKGSIAPYGPYAFSRNPLPSGAFCRYISLLEDVRTPVRFRTLGSSLAQKTNPMRERVGLIVFVWTLVLDDPPLVLAVVVLDSDLVVVALEDPSRFEGVRLAVLGGIEQAVVIEPPLDRLVILSDLAGSEVDSRRDRLVADVLSTDLREPFVGEIFIAQMIRYTSIAMFSRR